jgi:hypothetical protein
MILRYAQDDNDNDNDNVIVNQLPPFLLSNDSQRS